MIILGEEDVELVAAAVEATEAEEKKEVNPIKAVEVFVFGWLT